MKKAKNIVLLIGLICNSIYILLQIMRFGVELFRRIGLFADGLNVLRYLINGLLLPNLLIIVLMILPVILLILNLKNKAGKVLPIISAVMCGVVSLSILFSLATPTIPQYLMYSDLHLIDTYWAYWIGFITDGGILLFLGFALLTVGSIMSLIKIKE